MGLFIRSVLLMDDMLKLSPDLVTIYDVGGVDPIEMPFSVISTMVIVVVGQEEVNAVSRLMMTAGSAIL